MQTQQQRFRLNFTKNQRGKAKLPVKRIYNTKHRKKELTPSKLVRNMQKYNVLQCKKIIKRRKNSKKKKKKKTYLLWLRAGL